MIKIEKEEKQGYKFYFKQTDDTGVYEGGLNCDNEIVGNFCGADCLSLAKKILESALTLNGEVEIKTRENFSRFNFSFDGEYYVCKVKDINAKGELPSSFDSSFWQNYLKRH